MQSPKISIITVVYNGAAELEATIKSVLSLTWPSVEYIIIDGGSKDGTQQIIEKYSNSIAYWVSEKDKGIYDAMNKGLARVTGDWVIFMNCGDRFVDANVLDIFKNDLSANDIVYGDAAVEYDGFEAIYKKYPVELTWRQMAFCHQASFTKADKAKELKFDTSFRYSADYDFFFRAYLKGYRFMYVDRLICKFNYKEGASKDNKLSSLKERKRSSLMHHPTFTHRLYFSLFLTYAWVNVNGKALIGKNLTTRITKLLRR